MRISRALRLFQTLLFAVAALLADTAIAQQRLEPPAPLGPRAGNPFIREGDDHYSRRQAIRAGILADKGEIAAAVRAYDTAAEAADSAEARWKLARALCFQGNYTEIEAGARLAVFEKARRVSEEAVGIVERRAKREGDKDFTVMSATDIVSAAGKDGDAAPAFYWGAVSWSEWALGAGKEEASRLGAAQKVRDYASVLIALDPQFEEGGGYRLLGRVHDQAPRMQSDASWASREEAIRNLRLAVKTDAVRFSNRLFLAEALSRGSAAARAEAVQIARGLVAASPSPARLVEDLRAQQDAADDLRAWK